jgi:hypothetical protein
MENTIYYLGVSHVLKNAGLLNASVGTNSLKRSIKKILKSMRTKTKNRNKFYSAAVGFGY